MDDWTAGKSSGVHGRCCSRPRFAATERDHNSVFLDASLFAVDSELAACTQWWA